MDLLIVELGRESVGELPVPLLNERAGFDVPSVFDEVVGVGAEVHTVRLRQREDMFWRH